MNIAYYREKGSLSKQKVKLDDGIFVKADLKRLYKEEGKIFWDITLTEGKNREIKRIFKLNEFST